MKSPLSTKHKSVVEVPDYNKIEHPKVQNSDEIILSVGYAQWDSNKSISNREISAKVFRKNNGRWSRQSEEMPLNRSIDLTIFILSLICKAKTGNLPSTNRLAKNTSINNISQFEDIKQFLDKNKSEFDTRIKELKDLLNKI